MKKLLFVLLLILVAYVAWRWWNRGQEAAGRGEDIVYDRLWIDHMPRSQTETFRAAFLIDASGRSNTTGNQEKLRVIHPTLRKLAIFGHFEDVLLDDSTAAGDTVIIRLQNKNADLKQCKAADADAAIYALAEEHAQYGDAGKVLPEMMLLAGAKIIDLSGLMDLGQIQALARIELETVPRDSQVIIIADLR